MRPSTSSLVAKATCRQLSGHWSHLWKATSKQPLGHLQATIGSHSGSLQVTFRQPQVTSHTSGKEPSGHLQAIFRSYQEGNLARPSCALPMASRPKLGDIPTPDCTQNHRGVLHALAVALTRNLFLFVLERSHLCRFYASMLPLVVQAPCKCQAACEFIARHMLLRARVQLGPPNKLRLMRRHLLPRLSRGCCHFVN